MRGAVREDDGSDTAWAGSFITFHYGKPAEPYDDPNGNINRWCNHFYDPINKTALQLVYPFSCPNSGLSSGAAKAQDWALGTPTSRTLGNGPADTGANRRNYFSLADMKEAIYRATTGLQYPAATSASPEGGIVNENVRKAYWATAFRALGDILHLNQDMAQPQHTRNESHGTGNPVGALIAGHKSDFESKLDDWSFQVPVRHLRRMYPDPMTDSAQWQLLRLGTGIAGVRSSADRSPIKRAFFPPAYVGFEGKASYKDWAFLFIPPGGDLRLLK